MTDDQVIRIDGIKWWVTNQNGVRVPVPLCPTHDLKLTPADREVYDSRIGRHRSRYDSEARELECAEGPHELNIPREYGKEKQYVIDRIDAKVFKGMKVLNLDDEAVPIAESKVKSEDGKYFVTSRLMDSKRGLQLVLYAGEKGKTEKTQIFVEPEVKRMDFDRNDLNPDEVFVEVSATFRDGSTHTIKKEDKNEKQHPKT